LDNLKVILIAGIIFGHSWAGYDEIGGWVYTDAREVSISPVTEVVLEILIGPFALFAVGSLFLVSGLLTPGSLARKGAWLFSRDRLLRLGVPVAVFAFLLWPPVTSYLDRLAGATEPAWKPSTAHLWYVEVLLIFSLVYAAVPKVRPAEKGVLGLPRLLAIGLGIAAVSFVTRLWLPLDSADALDLHLNQWPQFAALFCLGVAAARRGWLDPVPDELRRACGIAALAAAAAIGVFAGVVAWAGVPPEAFLGGVTWASAATSAAEGLLAVTVSVWLLGILQQKVNTEWLDGRPARAAYAAFFLQGHVLVAYALAMRSVPVAAETKGLTVCVLGVITCFVLGWLLTTRTVLGRIF
jgi:hypothetical protein